ncbi:hypothetical protein Cal7507_5252 [Calothrix sp. PCC 7507]|nr:hypothetical protein Cal7507_5252 [Calothrix sp. PCC 7507]
MEYSLSLIKDKLFHIAKKNPVIWGRQLLALVLEMLLISPEWELGSRVLQFLIARVLD